MPMRIPNIGVKGQRRRLAFGVVGLAAAAALITALEVADAALAFRALVVLPLYAAALGFLQHREKT